MVIEAFVICDDKGQPIKFDEIPEDANNLEYGVSNLPVFEKQEDAQDVLNSLPGSASFEGFTGGTVRRATLTIGEPVTRTGAEQDDPDEDEEDDEGPPLVICPCCHIEIGLNPRTGRLNNHGNTYTEPVCPGSGSVPN